MAYMEYTHLEQCWLQVPAELTPLDAPLEQLLFSYLFIGYRQLQLPIACGTAPMS